MCDKNVDDNLNELKFVLDCYETQEICDKALDDYSDALEFFHDQFKTQEMCDIAIEDHLVALKFVSDWFVASTVIEKLYTTLHTDKNILDFDEDFDNVIFNCNKMGILNKDCNCINFDDNTFNEDDPDIWQGILNLKNAKNLKND